MPWTQQQTQPEQAQFKPQHAVYNVYFPGRMGHQPSHSTLCESIQHHAVPYAISHGCTLVLLQCHGRAPCLCPAQHVPQSLCKHKHTITQWQNWPRWSHCIAQTPTAHPVHPHPFPSSWASSPVAQMCYPSCAGWEACKAAASLSRREPLLHTWTCPTLHLVCCCILCVNPFWKEGVTDFTYAYRWWGLFGFWWVFLVFFLLLIVVVLFAWQCCFVFFPSPLKWMQC